MNPSLPHDPWKRSGWRLLEWRRRRARRRAAWREMRALGFEVVPRRELGSKGPILTPKGQQQARLHGAARDIPRGQG